MSQYLISHENEIRLTLFIAVFLLCGFLELTFPERKNQQHKLHRWSNNLFLSLLNTISLRLLFPILASGIALYSQEKQLGLFNNIHLATAVSIFISIILLDLIIYFQHRLFHYFNFLWRFHAIHHSDTAFDVSTAIRFHPIEIIISMAIKFIAIIIIGAPIEAVIIFEILLNAAALFNHSNLHLAAHIEKIIRLIIVTPDMHRIHHSCDLKESNSNFGFSLSCWDRVFKTYLDKPKAYQQTMAIGLSEYQDENRLGFFKTITLPFLKK